MSNIDTIQSLINTIYKADIQSIRNLANVSQKLQKDGLTIPGNLNVRGKFNYLPKGAIIIWNGTKPPKGWVLCDGKNGTPDLRGRFVYGYGSRSGTKFKRYGGSERHTLSWKEMPRHNHSGSCWTGTAGNHRHYYTSFPNGRGNIASGRYWKARGSYTGYSGNHRHSCGVKINNNGASHSHNNMPPYMVLAYIMKL